MWTTASKEKAVERQLMVGSTNWAGRFKFEKKVEGLFIKGTMDGKIAVNSCKTYKECATMYNNFKKLGAWNVPFVLYRGYKRIHASWTVGG